MIMKKREGVKRVLITSIGGGNIEDEKGNMILKNYHDTVYNINGEKYEKTSYMPKVVEKGFEVDKTIIIGTTGTMWDNVYRQYCIKNEKEIDKTYEDDLRETERKSDKNTPIEDLNIKRFNKEFGNVVKGIVIKYGLNREEIFENFDSIIKLEDEFNDNDEYEVILDITHSFRSTAFWMFLVMTYLTDVSNKNIKIIEVTYGMHEIRKKNDDSSPIILLDSFLEILDWIKGASELKKYGNSYHILENLKNNDISKDIKDELANFSNAMNMNYIRSLQESIKNLKKLDDINELDKITGPARHIIPDILKEFIKDFDFKENNDNKKIYLLQATLAKWHCSQKRYAMAAINISEAIVTFILLTLNINSKKLKGQFDPDNEGQKWLKKVYNIYKDKINLTEEEKQICKYGEIYVEVTRIRKEVAHSLGKQPDVIADIAKLEDYSKNIVDLLKNENIIKEYEEKLKILKTFKSKDKKSLKPLEISKLEKDNKHVTKDNEIKNSNENSILLLSTKVISAEEISELKEKWKFKNIIPLSQEDLEKWKQAHSETELSHFKNLINNSLHEGDYILIYGDLKNMIKLNGYASNHKKLKIMYFSDKNSLNDTFFREL